MGDATASGNAPILVAVDFSPGSEAAMRWAVDTAAEKAKDAVEDS